MFSGGQLPSTLTSTSVRSASVVAICCVYAPEVMGHRIKGRERLEIITAGDLRSRSLAAKSK
jgi:hypothetical protein